MPESSLSYLLEGSGENLDVEYKAWLDLNQHETRASLARHIAAIANSGGGYIVFGIDDKTRTPLGALPEGMSQYTQDDFAGIVKKYLDPRVQVQLDFAEKDGVDYPILIVPSHGSRPIVAISDGPVDLKGRRVGINLGRIYVRASGPESIEIRSPDDWNSLLERCLAQRADLLAKIMRQSLNRTSRPSKSIVDTLLAAVEDTSKDFASQTSQLAKGPTTPAHAHWLLGAGINRSVLAYALVGEDGELIELDNLRTRVQRVSVGLHKYAFSGWSSFYPVPNPERAPQFRSSVLLGQDRPYLEGMRLDKNAIIPGSLDYWRVYEAGIAVTAESFRGDSTLSQNEGKKKLKVFESLFRIHSLLAHARIMGEEIPGLSHVVIRLDFKGMAYRWHQWDDHQLASGGPMLDNEFKRTIVLRWAELRDSYFETLRKVYIPFFDAFPSLHGMTGETTITRDLVEREFGRFESRGNVKLVEP